MTGTPGTVGALNAFRAVTRADRPTTRVVVHLYDHASGALLRTAEVDGGSNFRFEGVVPGAYELYAGEAPDGAPQPGRPGYRWSRVGEPFSVGDARDYVFGTNLGLPDAAGGNAVIPIDGYVIGRITGPQHLYELRVAEAGTYVVETHGIEGRCDAPLESDTHLRLVTPAGEVANEDIGGFPSSACSRITAALGPGNPWGLSITGTRGRYVLSIRKLSP